MSLVILIQMDIFDSAEEFLPRAVRLPEIPFDPVTGRRYRRIDPPESFEENVAEMPECIVDIDDRPLLVPHACYYTKNPPIQRPRGNTIRSAITRSFHLYISAGAGRCFFISLHLPIRASLDQPILNVSLCPVSPFPILSRLYCLVSTARGTNVPNPALPCADFSPILSNVLPDAYAG